MTQTIDQRARELLARHSGQLRQGRDRINVGPALAALTEALTRVEELEGALGEILTEYRVRDKVGIDVMAQIAIDTLTKGITE